MCTMHRQTKPKHHLSASVWKQVQTSTGHSRSFHAPTQSTHTQQKDSQWYSCTIHPFVHSFIHSGLLGFEWLDQAWLYFTWSIGVSGLFQWISTSKPVETWQVSVMFMCLLCKSLFCDSVQRQWLGLLLSETFSITHTYKHRQKQGSVCSPQTISDDFMPIW